MFQVILDILLSFSLFILLFFFPFQGGGYVPGGYTVVTYPAGGSVGTGANGQETGGTTYYYQLPAAAAAGLSGPIPAAQPVPTSLQQYTLTPSTSSSYPQ